MSFHVMSCNVMYVWIYACVHMCLYVWRNSCLHDEVFWTGQKTDEWTLFMQCSHWVLLGTFELCFSHSLNVCFAVRLKGQVTETYKKWLITNHEIIWCFTYVFIFSSLCDQVLAKWATVYLLLCGWVCVCIGLCCVALGCVAFHFIVCSVWNHQPWTGSQSLVMQQ